MTRQTIQSNIIDIINPLDEQALLAVRQFSSYMAGPGFYQTLDSESHASIARREADYEAGRVIQFDESIDRLDAVLDARKSSYII